MKSKWNSAYWLIYLWFLLPAIDLDAAETWQFVETGGELNHRHEAAFVEVDGKFYLCGGRRIQPVDILDPATNAWTHGSAPPIEIHHFQPVFYKGLIYFICAMTGPYPTEVGLPDIYTYNPRTDTWAKGDAIPSDRIRGSAGVILYKGNFYIISGITRGHQGGFVKWVDEYDPETGKWRKLPDAPRPRDHFQAALVNGKIYAVAGRNSSKETNQVFDLTIKEVDVFDPEAETWSTLQSPTLDLPTPRAGNSVFSYKGLLLVVGGETTRPSPAHNEVEVFDSRNQKWMVWPSLARGRHGSGIGIYQGYIYTCAGSGSRGGSPELMTTERFNIEEHYNNCCAGF